MSEDLLSKDCNASVIRDLAAGIAEVNKATADSLPFILTPPGYAVADLEKLLPNPARIRATPCFKTLLAFIAYVEIFKLNATAIFANPDDGLFVAVIDYHTAGETGLASWNTHRPWFKPEHTIEWNRWKNNDNKWLDQRTFAEFIEENVDDIVNPSGATMLEIAQSLEAKTGVEFKSGVRLDNGSQRLTFASEVVAKAGDKGQLDIPAMIDLYVAPFRGGDTYPLKARFRYKIEDGKLKLRYQLVNPHKVIESAVKRDIETVATGTSIKPYLGIAP